MRRQGVPRFSRYSAMAAMLVAMAVALPTAQAFQANPSCPTDQPPLLRAKQKPKVKHMVPPKPSGHHVPVRLSRP